MTPGARTEVEPARLAALLEALATERGIEEVLPRIARAAAEAVGALAGVVLGYDEGLEALTSLQAFGPPELVDCPVARRRGQGPCGLAFETHRPQLAAVESDPLLAERRERLLALGVHSILALPILGTNGPLGVLSLSRPSADPPTSEAVTRASLFAHLAALALERERLSERARQAAVESADIHSALQKARRLASLQAVTASLAEALTVDEVAQVVAVQGYEAVTEASACFLVLLEADGETLRVAASRGGRPGGFERWRRFGLGAGTPVGAAVRTDRAVWLRSYEEIVAAYPELPLGDVSRSNLEAFAAVPIHQENRPVGALAFTFRTHKAFDAEKRDFLLTLGRLAGQAMERARLYDEERRRRLDAEASRRRMQMLADAGIVLASSLDWEDTVVRAARFALGVLADWCLVDVVENGGESPVYRRVAAVHADPAQAERVRELLRFPPDPSRPTAVFEAMRTGRTQLHFEVSAPGLDADVSDHAHAEVIRRLGLASFISTPLVARGRTLGAMSFARSRPDHRFVEADVPFAEELARRVALALENARLFEDATRAVRARDEFLSIAGHELRTPLTALQLQIQSLRRSEAAPDPRRAARIEKVAHHGARLSALVDELLDISQITAGHLELVPSEVDLVALCRSAIERDAAPLERAGCEVRVEAPARLVGRWDAGRLGQVVHNLLINAAKYAPGQPIDLRIEAHEGEAHLVVRDRGMGIAAEDQARIFKRFERAVSTRHFGGFGVGLWIAREVVEAHGGRIEVESGTGRGATFTVRLPLPTESP